MKKIKICALGLSSCLMLGGLTGCFTANPTTSTGLAPATSEESSATYDSSSAPTVSDVVIESSESVSETATSGDDNVVIESSDPAQNTGNDYSGSIDLDSDKQEYVNTFISNFAEQNFMDYDRDSINAEQVLDFVHIHLKINSMDSISYDKKGDLTFETFTVEKAQSVIAKYFGTQLKDDQLNSLSAPPSAHGDQPAGPFYENSKIWYEAADGESHSSFAVVDSAVNNGDGTITLNFTVYSLDLDVYFGLDSNGMKKYYKMTPSAAEADKSLSKVKSGSATVGVNQSGTYYLITYKTSY